ncbi:response regulator transcription factor [Isoptericola chiayiensis]|uniref:Response regulator transcription factor n=1 Tax=Isoptericola chiayiensis TaxID=579446 RepID=A0ABP8YCQ3_9MICO|nr:response regulator transcription factor [Isoptericola chiayiensis]NOW00804.1 DNA-binding NarL/FixJ family response regulator [Isoptericola chiayiensis]
MTVQEARVRVLLADDHAAIRAGLRMLLEAAGVEVVGEAADGDAAVTNARALRPDVVLMDLRMPGTDGITATDAVVREGLADVLVLTTFDLDDYVDAALAAGAAGFLLKSAEPAALVDAVRRVAAGDGVLAPEITRRVLARLPRPDPTASDGDRGGPSTTRDDHAGLAALTSRERDVLVTLGRGLSNQGVAAALGITEATAKTHVSRVLAKLGVPTRMQAAVVARDAGLV